MISRVGLTKKEASKVVFYRPKGCDECLQTGYRGRIAVFEIMEVNDEIAKLIVQRVDASVIKQKALETGMILLGADGLRCIRDGVTSIEEVLSVAYVEEVDDDPSGEM